MTVTLGNDSDLSATESTEIIEDKSCCKKHCCCCKFIPDWFFKELCAVLKLAWPLIITTEMQFGLSTVSLVFAGHLGTTELAAVSLANSLLNVACQSIGSGVTTACDTYFSQTYGSGNKKMVGVHVQRAVMIIFLLCFPVWSLLINAEHFLLILGQDPVVARISASYILLFTPGILLNYMFRISQKYLLNQNDVIPLLCVSICAFGISIGVNYYMIDQLELGAMGVCLAYVLGYAILFLLTMSYIIFSGMYKPTWGGFSKESFRDWGVFSKLAVAGMFMILLEWMGFEIGTLLAGTFGETELSAMAIIFQTESVIFIVYVCTSVACGVRLGQKLGQGDFEAARKVSKVAMVISLTLSTIISVFIASLNEYIPLVFTNDPAVIKLVSENLLILVIYFFLAGIAISHAGLLRGSGRQQVGAVAMFIGFYCCGLPVGIPLMLLTPLKLSGYWIGIIIAESIVGVIYVTMVWKTNWKRQTELAQERAGLKQKAPKMKKKSGYNETNIDEEEYIGEKTKLLSSGESKKKKTLTTIKREPVTCGLMLKRLFTFVFMICLLGASILFKIYVPVPEIGQSNDYQSANATLFPDDSDSETTTPFFKTITSAFV